MLRKIILILLTVTTIVANAQLTTETINSEILHPEKRFELLDRTDITTGNLINRALVFFNRFITSICNPDKIRNKLSF